MPPPLPELLEHDAVGESLSADPNPLQDAVASELLQHQVGVHLPGLRRRTTYRLSLSPHGASERQRVRASAPLQEQATYPLLVVGDDAAHKVGLGVVQRGHQFAQRLLVQLTHRAEHPLLGFGGAGTLRHLGHGLQTHHSIGWREERHRAGVKHRFVS